MISLSNNKYAIFLERFLSIAGVFYLGSGILHLFNVKDNTGTWGDVLTSLFFGLVMSIYINIRASKKNKKCNF